jgi:hypothetical protein
VPPYNAKGKSIGRLLDYENHLLDAHYGGSTTDYLQAAIHARAAEAQIRWAKIAEGVAARAWRSPSLP